MVTENNLGNTNAVIHPTVKEISRLLSQFGLRVFIIGARSIILHEVNLGRETRDWDLAIDRPFTRELRDKITRLLREAGYRVQWRKWGFLVTDDLHIDINYAPLTLDEDFVERSEVLEPGILLPSLEDLIILKLMSGEKKDVGDIKRILYQYRYKLDYDYLFKRAVDAGLDEQLKRILRRLGIK